MNENEYKLEIYVTKDNVTIKNKEKIHTGEYKITKCEFEFTEDYEGLTKKAIFEAEDVIKEMPIISNECDIPEEVLQDGYVQCNLRVYGYDIEEVEGQMTVKLRYSPTYDTFPIWKGSFMPNAEQGEEITPTQFEQYTAALNEGLEAIESKIEEADAVLEDIDKAIEETNNLDLDVSKEGKVATVTLIKKDATPKVVTLSDGTSLMFKWDGTKLGIKTDEDAEYTYVDLQGETGATPNIQIGSVVSGNAPSVTRTGTNENPILNFVLEKGEKGDTGDTGATGETGNGIASIVKTGTSGLVDTYTITFTDGTTTTFEITNGEDGEVTQAQLDATNRMVEQAKLVYNALPKVTGSGEEITLNNTAETPLGITLKGNTHQETTTGKNLLPYGNLQEINTQGTWSNNVYTFNGITYTINNDGSIKATGTASTASFLVLTTTLNLTNGTEYILNGSPTGGGISSYSIRLYDGSDYTSDTGLGLTFMYGTQSRVRVNVGTGTQVNNIVFYPMIRLSSITDDTYEPYTGNSPSPSPDYPQEVQVVTGNNTIKISNKNLFDINSNFHYNTTSAGVTSVNNSFTSTDYIPCSAGEVYAISGIPNQTNDVYIKLVCFDENKNFISRLIATSGTLNTRYANTATIPANGKYVMAQFHNTYITEAQLEKSSTTTEYVEHQEQNYSINLGTLELCKIGDYQDYITKTTGKNLLNVPKNYSVTLQSNVSIDIPAGTYTIGASNITTNATTTSFLLQITKSDNTTQNQYVYFSTKKATFTLDTNATNIKLYSASSYNDSADKTTTFTDLMLVSGDTLGDYEPYGVGKWYKKQYIGKVVLDGTENWTALPALNTTDYYAYYVTNSLFATPSESVVGVMSDYFIGDKRANRTLNKTNCWLNNSASQFFVHSPETTVSNFKAWLGSNNTIVYHLLATPTGELITEPTLIEQLNNLYYAYAYKDQTNINQENSNLASIMNAETTRDLSDIFTNEG